jgi:hypothetical protein
MRAKKIIDLPCKTPGEMLDLLSVLDPKGYRGACALLQFAVGARWDGLTLDAQRAAVEEVDRRRLAVADRPGVIKR